MATSSDQLHIDAAALRSVHAVLKKDIGAVHSLFASGPKPNTNFIKDLTDDAAEQYGLDKAGRAAALYLFSLAKVKGTETAEYNAFLNVLRHPCPRPPSDSQAFLPYLSFLCTPDRKKVVRDERLIDSKQYDPNDNGLIMPPHPLNVEKPSLSQRNAFSELATILMRAGSTVTLPVFGAAIKDVDRGVTTAEAKRLFTEGFVYCNAGGGKKMDENTAVPVNALLTVCKPQLTMERQKSRSSYLVKGAFSWDVPQPPTPNRSPRYTAGGGISSLSGSLNGSPTKVGAASPASGTNSPRSSSARRGFQPTKSAALREQLAKELMNDPTCPYYNKGVYKHIPTVPESHYKKQSGLGLTSRYSVRGGSVSPRNRQASAAEAQPPAARDETHE